MLYSVCRSVNVSFLWVLFVDIIQSLTCYLISTSQKDVERMREKNKVTPAASRTYHQKRKEIKTKEPLTVARLLLPSSNLLVSSFRWPFTITTNICKAQTSNISDLRSQEANHNSGAVWESRWPSWAVRPNEPSGFRGHKATLNHASALVSACPLYVNRHPRTLSNTTYLRRAFHSISLSGFPTSLFKCCGLWALSCDLAPRSKRIIEMALVGASLNARGIPVLTV